MSFLWKFSLRWHWFKNSSRWSLIVWYADAALGNFGDENCAYCAQHFYGTLCMSWAVTASKPSVSRHAFPRIQSVPGLLVLSAFSRLQHIVTKLLCNVILNGTVTDKKVTFADAKNKRPETVCSRITQFSPKCSGKIIVYDQSMQNLYQLII